MTLDEAYEISTKNIDEAIETLNNISVYEIDSGPKGDNARKAINLAILVLEKEKDYEKVLKWFFEASDSWEE